MMEILTNQNSNINHQFIEELKRAFIELDGLDEYNEHYKSKHDSVLYLLRKQIDENEISLKKLAKDYIKVHHDDTWTTSTVFGLFEAYLEFVSNETIEPEKAWYLSSRGGIIWPSEAKQIYSLKDIIIGIEGESFVIWLFDNSKNFNQYFF